MKAELTPRTMWVPLRIDHSFEQRCSRVRSARTRAPSFEVSMIVSIDDFTDALKDWSERRDLNSGPLAPHASALPDCATLRHDCSYLERTRAPAGDLPRAQVMIRRFSQPAAVSAAAPSSALRAQPVPASQSARSASRRCALLHR